MNWLPFCDACDHPYAEHTIGDARHHGDCFSCPTSCDYVYPPPACGGCGEPVSTYLTEQDDAAWHLTCWHREEQNRELLAQVYDGWEPPDERLDESATGS